VWELAEQFILSSKSQLHNTNIDANEINNNSDLMSSVFWDTTLRSPTKINRCFGSTCGLPENAGDVFLRNFD
jgi:hypothetical protein